MLKIGLTGGLGSGKSTVAGIFESLGIPVYYADDAAKRLMSSDAHLKQRIRSFFGEGSYIDDLPDRKYLAASVFNNPEKLSLLNKLVHPVTLADAAQWMAIQTSPYAIKEAALIFESDAHLYLDHIIGVSAPYQMRLERGMQRDNLTKEAVEARIKHQMEEEKKMELCDYVISNDENQLLIPQVLAIHKILLAKSKE